MQLPTMKKRVSSMILTSTHNAIKCSHAPAEKKEHRRMKQLICDWFYENKIDFHTEAVFRDNSRADIVVSEWGTCLEILSNETIEQFKKKKYPFPTIPIDLKSQRFMLKNESQIYEMLDDIATTNGEGAEYYIKKLMEEEL